MATVMTSKGQVTIPKRIREKFGLKPHDRILFKTEASRVVLDFEKGTILNAKRKKTSKPINFRAQREEFKKSIAKQTVKEMKR